MSVLERAAEDRFLLPRASARADSARAATSRPASSEPFSIHAKKIPDDARTSLLSRRYAGARAI